MSRGLTQRQLLRMQVRWFKDSVKIQQMKGRGTNDLPNLTEIGVFNCFYVGVSRPVISADRQAQNYDGIIFVRTPEPLSDRNARYVCTVTQNKSIDEKDDRNGPAEPKRTLKLEPVQIDEYPDLDNSQVFTVIRCQNAKD